MISALRIAVGVVAGHINECGGQATGGNFSADWKNVPDMAHIGFPIAEAYPNGEVVFTKHDGTGGVVTVQSITEQLLYEIGDPTNYITPEVIADFTSIRLEQVGRDRVKVSGVKGRPNTDSYKVSMSYADGYTAISTLTYAWPDALEKAKKADEILRIRLADLGLKFDEIRTEFLGLNSCHGPIAPMPNEINEVVLRVGVRGRDYASVERFGKEIAPLILTGLSAAIAFRAGLFNIGAEGQLTIGAFCTAIVGCSLPDLPAVVLVPLCLLAGMSAGAAWGAIPGFLKARYGAHEVINTIMMNFIAAASSTARTSPMGARHRNCRTLIQSRAPC